jgi:hypothetical protein
VSDLGSARRRHIADILSAYRGEYLTTADAIDAIEIDVFGCEPQPPGPTPTEALVTTAVAVLLVGRDHRTPSDAVQLGSALADELGKRGVLAALGGAHD